MWPGALDFFPLFVYTAAYNRLYTGIIHVT